jgi:DNA-binding NtrC family response regulator
VLTASDGSEALNVLQGEDIQIVLSDQRMPGISGAQLCAQIRELRPDTIRIIVTGFGGVSILQEAYKSGDIYYYLMKPCNLDQLKMLLHRAAEAHDLIVENRRLRETTGETRPGGQGGAWNLWDPAPSS